MKWFFVFRTCRARLKKETGFLTWLVCSQGCQHYTTPGWTAGRAGTLAGPEQSPGRDFFPAALPAFLIIPALDLGDFKNGNVMCLGFVLLLQRKLQVSRGPEMCRSTGFSHFPCHANRACQGEVAVLWARRTFSLKLGLK